MELWRTGLLVPKGCQCAHQALQPRERRQSGRDSSPNPRVVAHKHGLYENRSVPILNISKSCRNRETERRGFSKLLVLIEVKFTKNRKIRVEIRSNHDAIIIKLP